MKLTHDDVLHFHIEGYLSLEDLAPTSALSETQELLDGLFDRWDELPRNLAIDLGGPKVHDGPQLTPQVNGATDFEPRLLRTDVFHAAHDVARDLLGDKAKFQFDHSIYKPPGNQRETPWHQDVSYGYRSEWAKGEVPNPMQQSAHFWIPMQTATVESGCMWFIPRSNLGNLRAHHTVGHDPENHTLLTDDVEPESARVPCPVPAGGCTIHGPKTMHYTGPNQSDQPRRAWILIFGLPG